MTSDASNQSLEEWIAQMIGAQSNFYYGVTARLRGYFFCLWAFRKQWLRKNQIGRSEYFIKRGTEKLRRDLDVRKLLIMVNSYTSVLKAVFTQEQKILLNL